MKSIVSYASFFLLVVFSSVAYSTDSSQITAFIAEFDQHMNQKQFDEAANYLADDFKLVIHNVDSDAGTIEFTKNEYIDFLKETKSNVQKYTRTRSKTKVKSQDANNAVITSKLIEVDDVGFVKIRFVSMEEMTISTSNDKLAITSITAERKMK